MVRSCRIRRLALVAAVVLVAAASQALAQGRAPAGDLNVRWEELTAPDFVKAVERSGATAVIALGVLEKHGPHLPLGTDVLDSHELARRAAAKEYTIVFPAYYAGQIFEARHQPGTIAYSERLMWDLLQETVDEMARNGIRKIILVNGHGGNSSFLRYFCQAQLARRHDYAIFLYQPSPDAEAEARIKALRKTPVDEHAGEVETSSMLAHHPDIVHAERAGDQSGADLARLADLKDAYTAIWWYAKFPNHYGGDARPANAELGRLVFDREVDQLAAMIRAVKADTKVLELQSQFFGRAEAPLRTPQPLPETEK